MKMIPQTQTKYKCNKKFAMKFKFSRGLRYPDMNSQKVVAAKEKISEGIGIVQERQKMI